VCVARWQVTGHISSWRRLVVKYWYWDCYFMGNMPKYTYYSLSSNLNYNHAKRILCAHTYFPGFHLLSLNHMCLRLFPTYVSIKKEAIFHAGNEVLLFEIHWLHVFTFLCWFKKRFCQYTISNSKHLTVR
jgi:hypothetical protein